MINATIVWKTALRQLTRRQFLILSYSNATTQTLAVCSVTSLAEKWTPLHGQVMPKMSIWQLTNQFPGSWKQMSPGYQLWKGDFQTKGQDTLNKKMDEMQSLLTNGRWNHTTTLLKKTSDFLMYSFHKRRLPGMLRQTKAATLISSVKWVEVLEVSWALVFCRWLKFSIGYLSDSLENYSN